MRLELIFLGSLLEGDTLSKNLKECLGELKKMTNFFITFISTHQEEVETFQNKLNISEENQTSIHPSINHQILLGKYINIISKTKKGIERKKIKVKKIYKWWY